jgi:HK97 family phage prohead protease
METKNLAMALCEFKFAGDVMSFAGYASVFGGVDAYGDTIDPKAYDQTIKEKNRDRPIRMRWNHYGPIIGKWNSVSVDDKGLLVEGELTPGHSTAQNVYASMKHGAVDGLSIGYIPKKIEMLDDGKRRLLKQIDLVEISVVEEPADLGAKIGDVKSAIEKVSSIREMEALLRDAAGFSRADACALVARIKSLVHGDRVTETEAAGIAAVFERFKL